MTRIAAILASALLAAAAQAKPPPQPKPPPPAAPTCNPPFDPKDKSPGSYLNPLPFKRDGAAVPRLRKSASQLSAAEKQKLQHAYDELRKLPATDARGWL